MNVSQLAFFIKVAELEHLTQASECLNISEAALSKAIKKLETEVDVTLFNRKGRNIVLNEMGRVFLPYVKKTVETLSEGIDILKKINSMVVRPVILQTSPLFLYPGLFNMIIQHDDQTLLISAATEKYVLLNNLIEKKTDLCISFQDIADDRIASKALYSEPMVVVVPKEHHLSNAPKVLPHELVSEKFLLTSNDFSSINRGYYTLFSSQQQKPDTEKLPFNVNFLMEYVSYKKGIALMSFSAYTDLHKRNPIEASSIPVYITEDVPYILRHMLYWRKKEENRNVVEMKKIILDYFKNQNHDCADINAN